MTYCNRYAITLYATPVFDTSNLGDCFDWHNATSLALDDQGLFRRLETVLLPHSRIQLLEKVEHASLWKIKTEEYPYEGNHFVDDSFIECLSREPPQRMIIVPSVPQMIAELKKLEGAQYVWGGNWPQGIDFLSKFYRGQKAFNELSPSVKDMWQLKGVDCSGLLFYASNGYTPRNTSSLVNFGRPIEIEGLPLSQIIAKLENLDLIVWRGHVVCVFNRHETIESMTKVGVVRANLSDRLSQIMQEFKPANKWDAGKFVIRRWHPDQTLRSGKLKMRFTGA